MLDLTKGTGPCCGTCSPDRLVVVHQHKARLPRRSPQRASPSRASRGTSRTKYCRLRIVQRASWRRDGPEDLQVVPRTRALRRRASKDRDGDREALRDHDRTQMRVMLAAKRSIQLLDQALEAAHRRTRRRKSCRAGCDKRDSDRRSDRRPPQGSSPFPTAASATAAGRARRTVN